MRDSPDTWMPLVIGAYLTDTRALSTEGHGAYLLLLMAYWTNGGPLPDDDDEFAAITGLGQHGWRKWRPKLARFFTVEGGVWKQKRADIELAMAAKRHAAYRERSARANAAKATKKDTNKEALEDALEDGNEAALEHPSLSLPDATASIPIASPTVQLSADQPSPIPSPDDRPIDLKAELWRRGKLFLTRSGVPEPRAAPLIGRWRRDHGDGPVLDAMTRAEAECASEVVPFIEACLKGKSRHGQQRDHDPAAQRSAFDAGLAAAALRRMEPGR